MPRPIVSAALPLTAAVLRDTEWQLREETAGVFEIDRLLGRGEMGAVFLATEVNLGRKVALKVLPPERSSGADSIERFKREARTGATLDHPNIVPIYRISPAGRLFWYAMKYVDGHSLARVVRESGRMPLPRALKLLTQVADALDFAHGRGVIHRDVKQGNVLLDVRDRAYVTDFGIAKAQVDATLTAAGEIVGTPAYMPPEQWAGQALTGAADQYAFAIMTVEIIGGSSLFEGDSLVEFMFQHCTQPPDLQPIAAQYGSAVGAVFARALAKQPADRFPSVGRFLAAFETAVNAGEAKPGAVAGDVRSAGLATESELPASVLEVAPQPAQHGASAPVRARPCGPGLNAPSFAAIAVPRWRPWRAVASLFAAAVALAAMVLVARYLARSAAVSMDVPPPWASPPAIGRNPTAGVNHTCLVTRAGRVLCWGTGPYGQLGEGSKLKSYVPVAVAAASRFVDLDAGDSHTCGVALDGAVLCWGLNDRGQSGPNTGEACLASGLAIGCSSRPQAIPGIPRARRVAAGTDFTCSLGADSLVYCWGSNMRGQLGRPSDFGGGGVPPVGGRVRRAFANLAVGQFHACGVTSSGAIYCWGWDLYGQLGTPEATAQCSSGTSSLEACSPKPLRVEAHVAFAAVAAGSGHTCAITNDGGAYCWGYNAHGQVGSGAADPRIDVPTGVAGGHRFTTIASGEHFTCALTAAGEVWCWGDNTYGQMDADPGRLPASRVPVRIPIEGLVVSIGAGFRHACAIDAVSRVVCWGSNGAGQLGDGYIAEHETVVAVR